ncbi:TMhelix containing protein [Vibrio phage 1.151.O._10N.222.46.B1]|nr:TMhelix containing protein [Vibrio phage 1.151.O._10N.222.46.B1]
MKKLLIALLALSPLAAQAGGVYFGGWSNHLTGSTDKTGYEYNEKHDLIALEYKKVFVGTMLNSYDTRSYVLGYCFAPLSTKYVDFKILAGAVHGYEKHQNDILRMGSLNGFIAPAVEINTPYIQPTVMLFGEALTLTFKYEF